MNALTDATALDIATVLTLIGLVAACLRLFLGPSRSDRVVALDLITVLLIAIASLAALRFDDDAYLDLGLTLALVGFLATVAFARYVEREPARDEDPEERRAPEGGAASPDHPYRPDGFPTPGAGRIASPASRAGPTDPAPGTRPTKGGRGS